MLTLVIAVGEGQGQKLATDVLLQLSLPAMPVSEQLAAAKPDWQELVIQRTLNTSYPAVPSPWAKSPFA